MAPVNQPRRESLAACVIRWPCTTRAPWCLYLLAPAYRSEHRRARLLDLQEQRIVLAIAHQQEHHGLGPDRADADDLARDIRVVVVIEHDAPIGRERERA